MAEYKVCLRCKKELSLSNFKKDKRRESGYNASCNECCNKKQIVLAENRALKTHNKCCDCQVVKPISEFHIANKQTHKYQYRCKECMSKFKKDRYWNNHDVELSKMTKSRLKPENILQRKGYYQENKDEYKKRHTKLMSDENKKKHRREMHRKYEKENAKIISERKKVHNQKPEVKERRRKQHLIKKATDIEYNIKRRLRSRLRSIVRVLKNNKYKWMSSIELLGCDMPFFRTHIESQFKYGMSWDRLSEIDIDHIKPCASFDLTKLEEQKKCFHYTNLRPLWAEDNRRKNSLYNGKYIRNIRTKNKAA